MVVTSVILGRMDMNILNSNRSYLVKILQMFCLQSSTKIGHLTLSLKEVVVVDLSFPFAKSLARVTQENA